MQQISYQHGADAMSPVVRITAGHSVQYSLNNGVTISEFEDGETYRVPDHVASGMVARGWAEIDDSEPQQPGKPDQTPPPPPPHPGKPDQPPVKDPDRRRTGDEPDEDDETPPKRREAKHHAKKK